MRLVVRNPADLAAGALFMALAAAFLWLGSDLPMGSAVRMGPGYVPRLICSCLLLLGFLVTARGLAVAGEPVGGIAWRPLVLVLASIVVFAAALQALGLVAATLLLVAISGFADGRPQLRRAIALGLGLALFAVLLFVTALKLPIDIWPSF